MEFRTGFDFTSDWEIDHHAGIFMIGSCFTQSISSRLKKHKFVAHAFTGGIIFNPVSIHAHLTQSKNLLSSNMIVQQNEQFFHYHYHSDIHGKSKESLINKLQKVNENSMQALDKADYVIITLGTSFIYEHLPSGQIVANCHKVPQKEFNKRMLSVEEVQKLLNEIAINFSKKKIILTVSPVRHIKDTIPLNQVSKSVLRLACHQVSEANDNVAYFPAYEYLLDDLRDYRYFKEDMIHPTEMAVDYIYSKFMTGFMSNETVKFCEEIDKINKNMSHRPFNPNSEAHRKFLEDTKKKISAMPSHIDFFDELDQLNEMIKAKS